MEDTKLNNLLKDVNKKQNETIKHLKNIIIVLIMCWFLSICFCFGAFVWYESQFEYVEETAVKETYTEEMTTEGDNAYINNVEGSQYNDNASHNE